MSQLLRVCRAAVVSVSVILAMPALAGCGGSVNNSAEKPDQPVKSVPEDSWTVESGKTDGD